MDADEVAAACNRLRADACLDPQFLGPTARRMQADVKILLADYELRAAELEAWDSTLGGVWADMEQAQAESARRAPVVAAALRCRKHHRGLGLLIDGHADHEEAQAFWAAYNDLEDALGTYEESCPPVTFPAASALTVLLAAFPWADAEAAFHAKAASDAGIDELRVEMQAVRSASHRLQAAIAALRRERPDDAEPEHDRGGASPVAGAP